MAEQSSPPLTRKRTAIWIIGQPEACLPDNVLLTYSDVLRNFFHHHKTLKKTVAESTKVTCDELIQIWNKSRIPTTYQPHIIGKLKATVEEYNLIKKNKSRASDSQQAREKEFQSRLSILFDIAHKDARRS